MFSILGDKQMALYVIIRSMREGWERCAPALKAGLARLGFAYFKDLAQSAMA